jgi:large subunit ribosomal protein L17
MRHGDKINNLGRTSSHRKALLSNLACALIENKRIFTTLAKAKALRIFVEPIITKSKDDTTHSRRMAFSYLKNKHAVSALFKDVAGKVADRKGGYTRIIKTGNRQGDAAEMAMIELVDFNELYTSGKGAAKTEKAKTTRRGRSSKKKAEGTDTATETKSEE